MRTVDKSNFASSVLFVSELAARYGAIGPVQLATHASIVSERVERYLCNVTRGSRLYGGGWARMMDIIKWRIQVLTRFNCLVIYFRCMRPCPYKERRRPLIWLHSVRTANEPSNEIRCSELPAVRRGGTI